MVTIRYADPLAVSGGDGTERTLTGSTAAYNSLAQWAAARYTYANISAGIERLIICNISGTSAYFAENFDVDDFGCGADSFTNYADFVGDPLSRHRGVFDLTKASLATRTSLPNYAHVTGLQNGALFIKFSDYCVVDGCVSHIAGVSAFSQPNFVWYMPVPGQVQNRAVYDGLQTNSVVTRGGLSQFNAGGVVLVNCSGGYAGGIDTSIFGCKTAINCLANPYDYVGGYNVGGFTLDNGGMAYNCASSDDSLLVYEQNGRAFNCRHNQTFQLYDFMNGDLHLLETDTGAKGHGVARSEVTQFDIAGKSRSRASAIDIGAFQITSRPYPVPCFKPDWRNGV